MLKKFEFLTNVAVLLFLITACGGGGSGGSSTDLRVSSKSVQFDAKLQGSAPFTAVIGATLNNIDSEAVFVFIEHSDRAIERVTSDIEENSAELFIFPRSPEELGVGSYTDSVTVNVCRDNQCNSHYSGSPAIIAVNYAVVDARQLAPHEIRVEDMGVAFIDLPSRERLQQNVLVTDSRDSNNVGWVASGGAVWLSFNESGMSGQALSLMANPAGLAMDTLHEATVTVRGSDSQVSNTVDIQVSLWVGSSDPLSEIKVDEVYSHVVGDPIRPYIYGHSTSVGTEDFREEPLPPQASYADIAVFNALTGEKLSVIPRKDERGLGEMVVSDDGAILFIHAGDVLRRYDLLNNSYMDDIALSLPSSCSNSGSGGNGAPSAGGGNPGGPSNDNEDPDKALAYVRSNGTALVVVGAGDVFCRGRASGDFVYEAVSGRQFDVLVDLERYVASSANSKVLCTLNRDLSPYSAVCGRLEFFDFEGGSVEFGGSKRAPHGTGSFGQDIAVSPDGSKAYVVASSSNGITVFDLPEMTTTVTYPASQELTPTGVAADVDGRTLFIGKSFSNSPNRPQDFNVFNVDGLPMGFAAIGGIRHRAVAVTGDTMRAAIIRRLPVTGEPRPETGQPDPDEGRQQLIFIDSAL